MASEKWIQHWHGKWSLYSCSHFGEQYTRTVSPYLGTCVRRAVLVFRNGFSACYFPEQDVDAFGRFLAKAAQKDSSLFSRWAGDLRRETDAVLSITARKKPLYPDDMDALWRCLDRYAGAHLAVKKVVDYLPPAVLNAHLPVLEAARKYSEPVYAESEAFVQKALAEVARLASLPSNLALALLREDWASFWRSGKIPSKAVLEKRFAASALLFENATRSDVFGPKAVALESRFKGSVFPMLSGRTAYPGKVRGTVRIVSDPASKSLYFNKGDILVAGMTRPPFIPLMKKAGAVVTDAGGVLCHAAIVAREFRIPCVVGTLTATRALKDGDMVEVDAVKGTVRKI